MVLFKLRRTVLESVVSPTETEALAVESDVVETIAIGGSESGAVGVGVSSDGEGLELGGESWKAPGIVNVRILASIFRTSSSSSWICN